MDIIAGEIEQCTLPQQESNESENTENIMGEQWSTRIIKSWVASCNTQSNAQFSERVLDSVEGELTQWATVKGAAFVVLALTECEVTAKRTKAKLSPHLKTLKKVLFS